MRRRKNKCIYRSGFEDKVICELQSKNVAHTYEQLKVSYTVPESKHTYTPDLQLPNGIVVELKGYMDATVRKKMLYVIKQNPHLDIRMVFMKGSTKITKSSKTTYEMWATKNGIRFGSVSDIEKWAKEPARK